MLKVSAPTLLKDRKASHERDEIEKFTEKELKKLEKLGGKIITIWDQEYPPLLKKIYDPPILFYILGELIEIDQYSIAVVGTPCGRVFD